MKEMTVQATVESIPAITEFIDGELARMDCPMKAQAQIDVAIDELFGNIAHYAYGDRMGEATVRIDFDAMRQMVAISFLDSGIPFDPTKTTDPDVTLSDEERCIGGLGIFMVRKTMDGMTYERADDRNVLTIFKLI
ncbi:MAG: ATP-binding protein [Clostridia bacterium]|nr:ATP-binding protein [Clostridia bacterium]